MFTSTLFGDALAPSNASSTEKRTDIIIGDYQEPTTLDPNNMGDGAGLRTSANVYEALPWITDDPEIEPQQTSSQPEAGLIYERRRVALSRHRSAAHIRSENASDPRGIVLDDLSESNDKP